ncbi:hypothetical protein F4802DRAFT_601054 [Xylaria palmicola]|nr:hypothetical protein F4802DRAFT_601054 [Xylaria palmicola]
MMEVRISKRMRDQMENILAHHWTGIDLIISVGLLSSLYEKGRCLTGAHPQFCGIPDGLGRASSSLRYLVIGGGIEQRDAFSSPGESTSNLVDTGAAFSTFTGLWASIPDARIDTPFMSLEMWDTNLGAARFSGAELVIDDYSYSRNTTSAIVSTFLGAPIASSGQSTKAPNVAPSPATGNSTRSGVPLLLRDPNAAIHAEGAEGERAETVDLIESVITVTVAIMLIALVMADYGVDNLIITASLRNWYADALMAEIIVLKLLNQETSACN